MGDKKLEYRHLEEKYKYYDDKIWDLLMNQIAGVLEKKEFTEEEEIYNKDIEFCYEVQKLKYLTKMVQIDISRYQDELQKSFATIVHNLSWNYMGMAKKNRYDNVILLKILLAEDYAFWEGKIEEHYKCFFKRISDPERIAKNIYLWSLIISNEEERFIAIDWLTNTINLLAKNSQVKEETMKKVKNLRSELLSM